MKDKEIKWVLENVSSYDLEGLNNFLKQKAPHPAEIDDSIQEEERMVSTPNKSFPYIKVSRWLEATKDGDPSYFFNFSMESYDPNVDSIDLGTFNQEEILENLVSLQRNPTEKEKLKNPKINPQKDFEPMGVS